MEILQQLQGQVSLDAIIFTCFIISFLFAGLCEQLSKPKNKKIAPKSKKTSAKIYYISDRYSFVSYKLGA
jgi:hypothetical protein